MGEKIFDCLVLGGGPAGMSAALYAKRGNIDVAIIDITTLGGQPVNYLEIENYLGFPLIEGWELSEKFEEHINKFNIQKFTNEEIQNVDLVSDIKTIKTLNNTFRAKPLLLQQAQKRQNSALKAKLNLGEKG